MSKDFHELWNVTYELSDYFSRLGGAARYINMSESEIPLYIACILAQRYSSSFEPREYITPKFIDVASPVLEKAHSRIAAIQTEGQNLVGLIHEFVSYANSKIRPQDRSNQWVRFVEWVRTANAQQIAPPDSRC